ncbi:acyl-CoA dehydrogenase family protein [Neptunicoccus cionae]|uniref:acyl-CoA dehydrogenase family protein n=1 Tax=Neptunicoccus cionae TaxID=2035344 RepID=UPI000C792050|nr:acyl-CoA dehydrogenase family protein [Amylibacter cionae]PLS21416.1 pimeloyl-CoA dehydrogenase large subunit [Amylibacter cionae]
MELFYTKADIAFRDEVRAFLDTHLPQELSDTFFNFKRHSWEQMIRWHKILANKGWVAAHWPVEHGGTGWTPMQQYIFDSEAMMAGAPRLRPFGLKMIGPVLMRFGTDAQKERFLPRILSAEDYWCQGFSEPGAGSDLASLKTRAVRDGDDYIVNGQKTWTTTAQHANWMFTLVRTDPQAEKPQAGISMLLIDLSSPGVTVRPIRTIDGDHHVNEVFLEDVRVPTNLLVGEENRGWTCAKFLLGNERVSIANVGQSKAEMSLLKRLARDRKIDGVALIDDPVFGAKLADLEADFLAQEVTNLRMLAGIKPGGEVGPLSSLLKLRGSEIQQRIQELAMEAAGADAAPWRADRAAGGGNGDDYGIHGWLTSRAFTIFGGSSEVMKNIVAKQTLGL